MTFSPAFSSYLSIRGEESARTFYLHVTKKLDHERAECRLGYLQSNPCVSELYKRFGFMTYEEDSAFVYMRRGHETNKC